MSRAYRFGDVEVLPDQRQVLVGGEPAPLGARAFDMLVTLIDRRDRVVTKDELFELVWPGVIVEENNLHVQVSALRKLLGAKAVATVPGRGFRFTLTLDGAKEPAVPEPVARRHNLPAPVSRFIGREREVRDVAQLLAEARLVTLTSVGGTGKTRLSLQVAAETLDRFPDGSWFVELASVSDEARVANAVAMVLGLVEQPGRALLDVLAERCAGRTMLLVLDNCEHLLRGAAETARRLLEAAPGLRILASSREALHVTGEATYSLAALDEADAVRLFTDRTAAVQRGFELNETTRAPVEEICRRLDGIPLAIELAAARAASLSVAQIAERLNDCFRLLTRGDAAALPRQQTLRASIAWSYGLLTFPERILLRRLSVFAGGWTLEAAEAVGTGGDVEQAEVMDLLARLVEKSLVVHDAAAQRYRFLEIVRQYAFERLGEVDEVNSTRERHLDCFVALAEQARPELVGPNQAQWLRRLDADRDNFFAASAWSGESAAGAERGLRLVRALKHYFALRGLLTLGQRMTVEALARGDTAERTPLRRGAFFDAGQLACFMGRYEEGRKHLEQSLAVARELGDRRGIGAALQPLAMACLGLADMEAARAYAEEALEVARELGEKRNLAAATINMGQYHRVVGDRKAATPCYEEGLVLARELGDPETVAIALLNLAMVAVEAGDLSRAHLMLAEVCEGVRERGSKSTGQSLLDVAAGLAAERGEWETAARFFGAAEALAVQAGMVRDPADNAFLAPRIAKTRAALREAFPRTEAAGRGLAFEAALAAAAGWLASSR